MPRTADAREPKRGSTRVNVPAAAGEPVNWDTVEKRSLLPLVPNVRFDLAANPERWDAFELPDGSFEVLPALTVVRHQPGVNGCRWLKGQDEGGEPRSVRDHHEDRGFYLLPHSVEVTAFGETVTDYVHRFEVEHNGKSGFYYADRWTRPYKSGATVRNEVDVEGYRDFQRYVRDQVLPTVDPHVLKDLRARFVRMIGKGSQRNASPSQERVADVARGKLEAVERAEAALRERK